MVPSDPVCRAILAGSAGVLVVIGCAAAVLRFSPPLDNGMLPPLAPVVAPGVAFSVDSHARLGPLFDRAGYDPTRLERGARVPPIILERFPEDAGGEMEQAARKRRFVGVVLPIVLRVNRTIERQRATLEALASRKRHGGALSTRERQWLDRLAELYKAKPGDWGTLRYRIAPIPPSLVVAQAAAESGWGRSRFTLDGNALFGQWTTGSSTGIAPNRRDADKDHEIKAFDRLIDSVWHYVLNLNRHPAYRELRRIRYAGRTSGYNLAAGLRAYSQKGAAYVELIRSIIKQNDLYRLDELRLAEQPPAGL